MKAFGFEMKIGRVITAAEKPVASTMETQPSRPLKSSYPKTEIGDSGTRGISGIITEEYNGSLQGIQGIKVYDEMRRSDGTVRAACLVTTLPIRTAKWFIQPASEEQKDKDIANFVEHALFDWIEGTTWDDHLRQALLMIPFGVMVFEKVYGVKEHEGKTYVVLEKLAPRMPRSIQQWELKDKTFGIQQIRQDGQLAEIPGSKLLIFINEREGNNWWGTSMIRAAYKHWYFKNNFYKIDAIAYERQGLGVPMIKMPQGYTEQDEAQAKKALQNLRAHENAYLILPPGYEASFLDMGNSSTRDPEKSINHHNKEILISVLAQFLELGQTSSGGGSRALSEDHSDLFLNAMKTIADTIKSEVNRGLIKELVDMNFDDVANYPTLAYSGISRIDVKGLADAYNVLKGAGAIDPTEDDQQYLRAAMGLPPRTQDEIDEAKERKEKAKTQFDPNADPNDPNAAPKEEGEMEDAEEDDEDDGTMMDKGMDKGAKKNEKHPEKMHEHAGTRYRFSDGFESWRPLTFAEKKVSWKKIEDQMNALEKEFTGAAKEALTKAKDTFMAKLAAAIDQGDTKAMQELEIKFAAEYKALIKDAMKKAYEYGKNNVSTEIGVLVPANRAESLAAIDLIADTNAEKTAADLAAKAKLSAANAMKKSTTALQDAGAIDLLLEGLIDKSVTDTASVMIGQGINIGRNDVFERNKDDIHGLQRSEILDEVTCNFCLSMDGLIVDTDSKWAETDVYHSNCRGIWVAILKDEAELPDITDVPGNLGDYYGGEPNALVQPPRPIVRKDSPAKAEAERRKAEK